MAIIGPNGAGKTTLFNLICGAIPPSEGKIYIFGEDVTNLPRYKRVYHGLAKTFQITALFFEMTVIENIILALQGTSKTKFSWWKSVHNNQELLNRAWQSLKMVDLEDKSEAKVKNLAYGDQRLIELIVALASEPRIIALDEPTAGLSMAESGTMIKIIKQLEPDITLLLIEHDMDVAFAVAERIMVLNEGEVIALDTQENIRNNTRVQEIYLGREGNADECRNLKS